MDREQIAKATAATGIFAAVVLAVFALWFVLPALHPERAAVAQEEGEMEEGEGAEAGAPEMPAGAPGAEPGMMGPPSGAPGMGAEMPGGMGAPGGAAAGAGAGGPTLSPAPPVEPSRANPFVPIDTPEPEPTYVTSKTTYGTDWSAVPDGYLHNYPQPSIPSAEPRPLPPSPSPAADSLRISSVVWPAEDVGAGAAGRALATAEDPDGKTIVLRPGQRVSLKDKRTEEVHHWQVIGMEPHVVVLQNLRTGRTVRKRIEARSRAEREFHGASDLSSYEAGTEDRGGLVGGGARQMPEGGSAGAGGMGGYGGGMGPGGQPGMMMPGGPGMGGP